MIYQLSTGKIIHITLEQYLDLTDEEIQYLNNPANNFGDHAHSPFYDSSIFKKKRSSKQDEPEIDKAIDYVPEDEDKSQGDNTGIEEIPLDELPDIPDDSIEE